MPAVRVVGEVDTLTLEADQAAAEAIGVEVEVTETLAPSWHVLSIAGDLVKVGEWLVARGHATTLEVVR